MTDDTLVVPSAEQEIDDSYYDIHFKTAKSLLELSEAPIFPWPYGPKAKLDHQGDEPNDVVDDIEGEITLEDDEVVGKLRAQLVHIDRVVDEEGYILDALDAESDELVNLYPLLFNQRTSMLRRTFRFNGKSDFLLIQRVEVHPAHRGRHLGHRAVLRLFDVFASGCALAVLKPFPLQFAFKALERPRDGYGIHDLSRDEEASFKKVRAYWSALGFKPIRKSNYFALVFE